MQARNNTFIEHINNKYNHFKNEILSTNLGENICKTMNNQTKQSIFKYQEFLFNYMKDLNNQANKNYKELDNRGLLIYHGLGSGKTTSGILLSESCRNYNLQTDNEHYKTEDEYTRKVILMIPANLFYDPWVKEISSKCFHNCNIREAIKKILDEKLNEKKEKEQIIEKLLEFDYHIIHYNAYTISGGYREKLLNIESRKTSLNKYTNKYSERNNVFDDSVVIIDECHNFVNMISNKLQNNKTVDVYEDIKNSQNTRLILLSATPIINDPFEIGILSNIIRGNNLSNDIKFEDDYLKFQNTFVDTFDKKIINQNMLRRRLNGIISYNKGINDKVFASKIEEEIYVPFSLNQENGYIIAEKIKTSNYEQGEFDLSALFKRKASNVVLPNYIFDRKLLNKKKLKKNNKLLVLEHIENKNNLLDETITKELQKKIIKILDNDDKPLHIDNELSDISKKTYHIIKKIKESNGPVLVYSNFVGLYGIQFIAEALKQNGFTNYNDKKVSTTGENGTFIKWTGSERNIQSKEIFNDLKNKTGDIIKVFLMTSSGKEGINLISIRQIHILEPWWNYTLIKQVIGRGIRICSHNHIDKKDFIDFRFKKELKTYNNRIVNVFKYYGFVDLRNDEGITKKRLIQRMKDRSIDYKMKTVSDNKEIYKKTLLKLMKEVSIDCDINSIRNNEDLHCYIDRNYNNYFDSWNIQDNEIPMIQKKYKIFKNNNLLFFLDQFNNVYKLKNQDTNIDINNLDNLIIKIGTYENRKINYINDYYRKERLHTLKKKPKIIEPMKPDISTLLKKDLKKLLINNLDLSINQILQLILDGFSGIDSKMKKDLKKHIRKYVNRLADHMNKKTIVQIEQPIVQEEIIQTNDIGKLNECMKMILKDIKKSKEYKNLPKTIGKSKLNKIKLCKAINQN